MQTGGRIKLYPGLSCIDKGGANEAGINCRRER